MTRGRRRYAALAAPALAAAALAGCGGSSSPTAAPPTTTQAASPGSAVKQATKAPAAGSLKCVSVPEAVVRRIHDRVLLDGARFHRIEAVASPEAPGYYFVSGTVSGGGSRGESIATWATQGLGAHGKVLSVDAFAALISAYGNASEVNIQLNIHKNAAYRSRVCVGGPHASHGVPAPASGIGNAPATG